jgi:hypothetical protein
LLDIEEFHGSSICLIGIKCKRLVPKWNRGTGSDAIYALTVMRKWHIEPVWG